MRLQLVFPGKDSVQTIGGFGALACLATLYRDVDCNVDRSMQTIRILFNNRRREKRFRRQTESGDHARKAAHLRLELTCTVRTGVYLGESHHDIPHHTSHLITIPVHAFGAGVCSTGIYRALQVYRVPFLPRVDYEVVSMSSVLQVESCRCPRKVVVGETGRSTCDRHSAL